MTINTQCTEPSLDVVVKAVNACHEAKAKDPVALHVKQSSDIADYFLVVSGRSDRHVQGIANRILDELGKNGLEPYSIEGFETGHWILLDYDDLIIHVFYEPNRAKYDLEGLWSSVQKIDFKNEKDSKAEAA